MWTCDQCRDHYCKQCFVSTHKRGRRREHTWTKYVTVQKEEEVAAATTRQKHVRGWLVRVKWRKVTLPMLLLHQRMSVKVMEDLVAEYLRDEFVPDLLIEIFNTLWINSIFFTFKYSR